MIRGKRVLVTGAGGFIGSHLTERLVASGAKVRAFVRYNSGNSNGFLDRLPSEIGAELEVVRGDLRDPYAVSKAVQGMDVVFHLGALIAIPYSYQHPNDVVQTNVIGTLNVAQAVLEHGVPRLVHTSTSEVYGTARYVPMDEGHPLQGQSPYSASKIGADKIIESFYCSYTLPAVTVRPFNAYGPRQSMRAVIPTIINQALHKKEIVLGNLSSTRDFTFVEDTARAFCCAGVSDQAVGRVVNAGSGAEISIGKLVEKVQRILGTDLPVRVNNERVRPEKSEVDRLYSNSSLASSLIGWKPEITLDEGLRRTVRWMQDHPELYKPGEYVI